MLLMQVIHLYKSYFVNSVPKGLEDVSKFPDLIALLAQRGLNEEELKKIVGDNLLRVMRGAERVC